MCLGRGAPDRPCRPDIRRPWLSRDASCLPPLWTPSPAGAGVGARQRAAEGHGRVAAATHKDPAESGSRRGGTATAQPIVLFTDGGGDSSDKDDT